MTGSRKLPVELRAEKLLRDLPVPARSEDVWEAQARSILSKLQPLEPASDTLDFLTAPLPEEPGEQEQPHHSDFRRPSPVPARRPTPAGNARRGPSLQWLLAGVVGVAAAAWLVLRVPEWTAKPEPPTAATPAESARPPSPTTTNSKREPAPALSTQTLARESAGRPPSVRSGPSQHRASSPARQPERRARAGGSSAPELARPSAETLEPNPLLKPADGREPLVDRPSQGALAAALDSVMPRARSCLAGQKAPVPVEIVFGSDGRARAVMVGGAAAARPEANCIRSALGKAHVQPFAKPAWTVRRTVRPPQ
jgi:hypothetical protein